MIENLNGIFETVNYKENTNLRLYVNEDFEDYPPHWHTPIEIIMPTKNIYTAECGEQRIVLQEGDILFINPGCVHTLFAPEKGVRIIFQADLSILRGIKELHSMISILPPALVLTKETFPDIHPRIQELLLAITDEYEKNLSFSETLIYGRILEILTLIGRDYARGEKRFDVNVSKQQEYTEKFLQICDYIGEHCTEDLCLDDISSLSGFSKFYFTRLFKQFTGVSFYKYLNQKRIAVAEQLLIDPQNSVTDVAINCGFSSLSSFIRMFKIIKGCTPTEFRNLYVNNLLGD